MGTFNAIKESLTMIGAVAVGFICIAIIFIMIDSIKEKINDIKIKNGQKCDVRVCKNYHKGHCKKNSINYCTCDFQRVRGDNNE